MTHSHLSIGVFPQEPRPRGSPRTVVLLDEKGRGLRYQNKESFLATGPAASELKHLHQYFPYLRGPEWGHQSHHESAITHQCILGPEGGKELPKVTFHGATPSFERDANPLALSLPPGSLP